MTPQPFKQIDAACLTRLLHTVPGHDRDVTAYHFLREDPGYAVIVATLAHPHQQIIIKLAEPGAALAPDFERSAAIVQLVRAHSEIATFEVLAVDSSFNSWPWQYLITTLLPGRHWSSMLSAHASTLSASLGKSVGQLHNIAFSSCGEIAATGNDIASAPYYEALVERAQRRIANPTHAALFRSVLQQHSALFEELTTGTLCHEDLNPSNLLVQEAHGAQPVVALIDFDSAWAGCGESDLARLELWRGMIGEGFWEAYRACAPLSDNYPERRPIYQLLWCLEYARPTAQHLHDTALVCKTLHIPPVVFA